MRNIMNVLLIVGFVAVVAAVACQAVEAPAAEQEARVFELRTYTTHPGKLDDLHKRFRDHTCELFKKHGMEMIGYWTPADEPESENTLIYILAFPSREARNKAFDAFRNDPAWQKAFKESRADGPIVEKVQSKFITPTDYSPMR